MFDIGWSEMAIIALVALVVLGPKELPQAMRTFANFSKKMRRYAQEFRAGVDNIVREADLEDARKALETARSANPKNAVKKLLDPTGEISSEVNSIESEARNKGTEAAKPTSGVIGPVPPGVVPATAESGETGAATPSDVPVAEKPASNIVTEPLNIAPPHSLRPPAPVPVEIKPLPEQTASQPSQGDDKTA